MKPINRASVLVAALLVPALMSGQEASQKEPGRMLIKTITIIDGDTTVNEQEIDLSDEVADPAKLEIIKVQEIGGADGEAVKVLRDIDLGAVPCPGHRNATMKVMVDADDLPPGEHPGRICKVIILDDGAGEPEIRKYMLPPGKLEMNVILDDSLGEGPHLLMMDQDMDIDSLLRAHGINPDSVMEGKGEISIRKEMMPCPHGMSPRSMMHDSGPPCHKEMRVEMMEDQTRILPGGEEIMIGDDETFFNLLPDPVGNGLRVTAPGSGRFILTVKTESGDMAQKQVTTINDGNYQGYISLVGLNHGTYFVTLKHGETEATKRLTVN